jgi:archaemetzincin
MSSKVAVVAIGKIEPHILFYLCEEIKDMFHEECILGIPLPLPEYAFVLSHNQYSASSILEKIDRRGAEHVLGVVDLDLFASGLNFVFGQADLLGKRAVVALPRLRNSFYGKEENEALFLERTIKEAIHELGHTFGLRHCSSRLCVMAFSNSLLDTDYKNREFCSKCARMLDV